MRITRKGRITVPAEVCEQAGLFPDTEVEFAVRRGVVVLQKVSKSPARRGTRLIAHLRGKASRPMSTDEILVLTRG